MNPQDTHLESISRAVGRIPSGVAILTARADDERTGMLASWMQQASFDPLMITVAVKKGRPIEPLIDRTDRFVLNILLADPTDLFKHFGRGFGPGQDAFDGLEFEAVEAGITLRAALAHLHCDVETKVSAGDHWLYVARVTAGQCNDSGNPHVHIRKSALNY